MINVAMVQMRVFPGEKERNLNHAREMIRWASDMGADIAILPECCDFGWSNISAIEEAESLNGQALLSLCDVAVQAGIYVVAGIVTRQNDRLFNTAVLISDKGVLIGSHRKINLVPDVEDHIYTPGNSLAVFDTKLGKIAIPICADNFESTSFLGESLGFMNADMILSPCSWAVPREELGKPYGDTWIRPYTHIANRFRIPVIGVSNVGDVTGGAWDGWYCIGNSIAINRDGETEAILPYGKDAETIHIVRI